MELQERYKQVRFLTYAETFFMRAGLGFRLHDMEEDEKEEGEQEEEVQGTHKYGKIFHFSFCFFFCTRLWAGIPNLVCSSD